MSKDYRWIVTLRDFDNYNLSVFKNDPTVSPEILEKMVLDLKKQLMLFMQMEFKSTTDQQQEDLKKQIKTYLWQVLINLDL